VTRERVGGASDVPVGSVRVVECAGGRSLALANVEGELYAIDNVCTHDAGPLGEGELFQGRVVCPRHGAAFDPKTGRVLSLPAVRDVEAYEVSVDGDDVYVDCPSDDATGNGGGASA
jgi:3-phenylpropionate/trans-cinnamate dioxygenase ferredoxin subunit